MNQKSLNDRILSVLNLEPKSFDVEDNFDTATEARVIEKTDEILIDLPTKKRKNIDLDEEKYRGKIVKRTEIFNDFDDSKNLDDYNYDDSNVNSDDDVDDEINDNEEYDSENCSQNIPVNSNDNHNDLLKLTQNLDKSDDGFVDITLKHSDSESFLEKSKAAQNQLRIYQELLHFRISFQQSLITANQLRGTVKNESVIDDLNKASTSLLTNLLNLKEVLTNQYSVKNDDNEEITSDESVVSDDDNFDKKNGTEVENSNRKKNLEVEIKQCHKKYKNIRNSILKNWYEKTRLAHVTKTNKNETQISIVDQINYLLNENRAKLMKKIHTKRMDYKITANNSCKVNNEQIDLEIFDDLDFYNEILRESMLSKTGDITDPILLSKQWAMLNTLRKKVKKNIDTKATKGRRIRYTVHKKLVNFMAPDDYSEYTDEAKDALFCSLFGRLA